MHNTIQQNKTVKFLRLFFPLDKKESILLGCLLFFYLCISLYIAFFTSLIDHPTKETDLYFSLDNPLIFKYGRSQISGHPLTIIFYYPFVILGNFLAYFLGVKAKTVLFATLSSVMISLSCIYINRYIKKVVELKDREALLITIFFALFSTNLILCFTPETFTLATFFLSFCAYYFAIHIKKNEQVPLLTSTFLSSICLGGVTVTNFVKGIIPLFFLKENKRSIAKKVLIAGGAFLCILIFTQIVLHFASGKSFFHLMIAHKQEFVSQQYDSISEYLRVVYSNFWGGPIFFSRIIDNTYYSYNSQQMIQMLNNSEYNSWWQYLFITILTAALIFSVMKNYKNRFIQILVLLLSVDLGIHIIMRFGIDTPFIYGGHWVYTIPLILAWLFKDIKNIFLKRMSIPFLFFITTALSINNMIRLIDFVTLAQQMFPPVQ